MNEIQKRIDDMKQAWLIYRRQDSVRNKYYIETFQEEGKKRNVNILLMLVDEMDFGVYEGKLYLLYQGKVVDYPDFVICRTIFPLLTRHLELMGIRVFNNSRVAEVCNDKAKTYQMVSSLKLPMINTSFYYREDYERAEANMNEAHAPYVIKAVDGHGGSQVFLSSDKIKTTTRDGIAHSHFVVQPLTGSRHQDLRTYVIGKEIIGSVLRSSKEGFRSNFSLGGKVESYQLKEMEEACVRKIINEFDFGMVGIDFIIGDEGELIFNEIEDVVGSRMLYHCSKVNFIEKYLEYMLLTI